MKPVVPRDDNDDADDGDDDEDDGVCVSVCVCAVVLWYWIVLSPHTLHSDSAVAPPGSLRRPPRFSLLR